jgi:hypothetical protein
LCVVQLTSGSFRIQATVCEGVSAGRSLGKNRCWSSAWQVARSELQGVDRGSKLNLLSKTAFPTL